MEIVSTPNLWQQALDIFRAKIDENNYSTWLRPTRFHSFIDNTMYIAVPSAYFEHWLTSNYSEDLLMILRGLAPNDINQLKFITDNPMTDNESAEPTAGPEPVPPQPLAAQPDTVDTRFSYLGNKICDQYTFSTFVVGENNRFAHAAAKAMADPHSKAYNPLFLYGGVGLGKTHLMHAIGHEFRGKHPMLRTLYVTSEQFVAAFIDAITGNKLPDFRNLFRRADLLMIDDIQFLAGKEQTQNEFFHTFNELYQAGKKIVITSDRMPKELSTLEERLTSRFDWGLTVDIQPPNLETRIAILKKKAQLEQIDLTHEVALFIAEQIQSNIRELEGALHRLKIYSRLHERPVSLEMTREVLGHLMNSNAMNQVNSDLILQVVCDYFQVKLNDMVGSSRKKNVSAPRHIAMYLIRELTDMPYKDIADVFGGRDHSSVMYASSKVKKDLQIDTNVQNSINFLMKKIRESA